MMNIFEQASRAKLRFNTSRGEVATESLWDMPLTSKNCFDLDTTAKAVNAVLKAATEDSFVAVSTSPAKNRAELQLEILKHVIAAKIALAEDARTRAAKAAERAKLIDILGDKQDAALKDLSPEELAKRIAELG